MRRFWRLVRLFSTMLGHTVVLSLAVRLRPEADRPAFRAQRQRVGTQRLCRILGVHVALEGRPPAGRSLLAVCNHLGVLDPIVLASQVPVAFAGKAEIRSWPFLGWVARTFGVVFVDRERPTRTSRFVQQVHDKVRSRVSVLVFPEGTTSRGDTVRPFKTGAFEAVAEWDEGAVLPLHLAILSVEGDPARREEAAWFGNTESFLRHGWRLLGLRRIDLRVRVGAPLETAGRDRKTLARLAHDAVTALVTSPAGPPAVEHGHGL